MLQYLERVTLHHFMWQACSPRHFKVSVLSVNQCIADSCHIDTIGTQERYRQMVHLSIVKAESRTLQKIITNLSVSNKD